VRTHERAGSGDAHHQGRSTHDTDSRRPSPSCARGILDIRWLGFLFELQRLRADGRDERLGLARDALGVPVDAFEEERLLDVGDRGDVDDVGDVAKRGGKGRIGKIERR
jgi:hypothetical protein